MVLTAHTLDVDVCKAVMKLLTMFPKELKKIWVTAQEMHQWLILCGVDNVLCPEMLVNVVIRRANRNGLLSTRMKWHTTYYRSCEFDHESMVPNDQKRLIFHSRHLESLSNPQAAELLSSINAGLQRYTDIIATPKPSNFTEEQHKVLEQLLYDIRKNPTICELPRAQYLVDFFLEIKFKSNPILYESFHRQNVTVTPTSFNIANAESTTDHTTNDNDGNDNNNNNNMVPITLLGDTPPNNTPREDCDNDFAEDDNDDNNDNENNCDSYDNIDDDEGSFGSLPDQDHGYNLSDSFPSSTESPTANQHLNDNIDGNESFGIFDIPLLNDFVSQATLHSVQCSAPMELVSVDKRMGAGIVESWRCSACQQQLKLRNCKSVITIVKERGRKYSSLSPEINVKIAAGFVSNGINSSKGVGFISGSLGIKMSTNRNLRHTLKKVRPAIHEVYLVRKEENMKQHVEECRKLGYKEINYTHDGVEYSAMSGPVAIDGVGCKRAYRHNITGTETACIVQSPVAGVCLHLEHSQVSM